MAERGVRAMRAAGLKPLSIHDCPHTYAPLMIAAGVKARGLSEFMGHATIAITFDLYGHLMPARRRRPPGCSTHSWRDRLGTDCSQIAAHPQQPRSQSGAAHRVQF
ncbi:MAG: hypothetical protein ICV69_02630 [Thermoleophilaceae bacterium]|nr:hypothetical protein [Thermoleophilaceae bacterium]